MGLIKHCKKNNNKTTTNAIERFPFIPPIISWASLDHPATLHG